MLRLSHPTENKNVNIYHIELADDMQELEGFIKAIKHKYSPLGYIVKVQIDSSVLALMFENTAVHCNEIEENSFNMVYTYDEIDISYKLTDEQNTILHF